MLCSVCLCLEDPEKGINIFHEIGIKLNIAKIIEQHMWFKPQPNDDSLSYICHPCIKALVDFHDFYDQAKKAHDNHQFYMEAFIIEEDALSSANGINLESAEELNTGQYKEEISDVGKATNEITMNEDYSAESSEYGKHNGELETAIDPFLHVNPLDVEDESKNDNLCDKYEISESSDMDDCNSEVKKIKISNVKLAKRKSKHKGKPTRKRKLSTEKNKSSQVPKQKKDVYKHDPKHIEEMIQRLSSANGINLESAEELNTGQYKVEISNVGKATNEITMNEDYSAESSEHGKHNGELETAIDPFLHVNPLDVEDESKNDNVCDKYETSESSDMDDCNSEVKKIKISNVKRAKRKSQHKGKPPRKRESSTEKNKSSQVPKQKKDVYKHDPMHIEKMIQRLSSANGINLESAEELNTGQYKVEISNVGKATNEITMNEDNSAESSEYGKHSGELETAIDPFLHVNPLDVEDESEEDALSSANGINLESAEELNTGQYKVEISDVGKATNEITMNEDYSAESSEHGKHNGELETAIDPFLHVNPLDVEDESKNDNVCDKYETSESSDMDDCNSEVKKIKISNVKRAKRKSQHKGKPPRKRESSTEKNKSSQVPKQKKDVYKHDPMHIEKMIQRLSSANGINLESAEELNTGQYKVEISNVGKATNEITMNEDNSAESSEYGKHSGELETTIDPFLHVNPLDVEDESENDIASDKYEPSETSDTNDSEVKKHKLPYVKLAKRKSQHKGKPPRKRTSSTEKNKSSQVPKLKKDVYKHDPMHIEEMKQGLYSVNGINLESAEELNTGQYKVEISNVGKSTNEITMNEDNSAESSEYGKHSGELETAIDPFLHVNPLDVEDEFENDIASDMYEPSETSDTNDSEVKKHKLPNVKRAKQTSQHKGKTQRKRKSSTEKIKSSQVPKQKKDVYKLDPKHIEEMIQRHIPMACCLCVFVGKFFSDIREHFTACHPNVKPYILCCDRKLTRTSDVAEHALKHEDPNCFNCLECNKSFSTTRGLSSHNLKYHAPEEEKIYSCNLCPNKFASSHLLDTHKTSHIPKDQWQFFCTECEPQKSFASKYLLSIHKSMQHKRANKVCHVCAKVMRDKYSFEKHVRLHFEDSGPRIPCPYPDCDSWLKDEYNLKLHVKRHNPEATTYKCTECDKTFKTRQALRNHKLYTHSNKTFSCEQCDKTFKKAISLREHMTQHTGDTLYKCPFCTRTFNSNANMHAHKKHQHPKEWDEWRKNKKGSSQVLIGNSNPLGT